MQLSSLSDFSSHLILKSKVNGWQLRFKEERHKYKIKHFKRVNEKWINETEILILIFLNGILRQKIRSEKIRLTFVESNINEDKKKMMVDGNTFILFELKNILQKYIWLLLSLIFPYLDCEQLQRTHNQIS